MKDNINEQTDVVCPRKGCASGLFKVKARPRLWAVYCAVEGCGSVIMDVSKPHIIPLLWQRYGLTNTKRRGYDDQTD